MVSLPLVDLGLFCLIERCLLAGEGSCGSPLYSAFGCSVYGSQVNCSWKVGTPFNIIRLKTAFPKGHSLNLVAEVSTISSPKMGLRGDGGLRLLP